MTITLRLVKGSALTFAEQDGNITDLNGRLTTLEAADFANPIDAITISGNQLTFHYTTAAGGGADTIIIPTAQWNGRGDWLPSTVYAVNDLVIAQSNLYLVKIAHTSNLTFDPGAQIGGNDIYDFIFGPMGQTESAQMSATAYTLQGMDNLKYYRCTSLVTSATIITIPASADVSISLDSEISFRQNGDPIVFQTGSGVILNHPQDTAPITAGIGAVVTLKKIGADEWDLFGRLQVAANLFPQPASAALLLSGSAPRLFKSLVPGAGVLTLARGTPIRTP
jgi:hypothetical protein